MKIKFTLLRKIWLLSFPPKILIITPFYREERLQQRIIIKFIIFFNLKSFLKRMGCFKFRGIEGLKMKMGFTIITLKFLI